MKKIIALVLLICMLVLSALSFSSCELLGGIGNGSGVNGNGGENTDDGNSDISDGTENGNGGNGDGGPEYNCEDGIHIDTDNNDYCDKCNVIVVVVVDFYAVNDLHGKFCDTDSQPGVDELATFFDNAKESDDHVVLLSSGDMWQGAAESNLTNGFIITEWMNEMDFVSMTLGNHEFDWGEEAIRNNLEIAEFPFLAINIYDINTGKLADYCTPSIMIERGGIQIGIIGAIGDCYSSISSDMVENVTFKVGSELTKLVEDEAKRLRQQGADLIVYSVHEGYSEAPYGIVDVVFEAHTHSAYCRTDSFGIYHIQGGGENDAISHIELTVNTANDNIKVSEAKVISNSKYSSLADDPETEALEEKYSNVIEKAYEELGRVTQVQSSSTLSDIVSELYLEVGLERWGDEYDIVLGGGFIKPRSPYDLAPGLATYADVLSIFPFNNRLTLCSVSGRNLINKFLETSNTSYHVTCSAYGESIRDSISYNKTYYIVVDTYTAFYAPNGLTVVEYYDDGVYARDLLAEEIKAGRFELKVENYDVISVSEALQIGRDLSAGEQTRKNYYVQGTIVSTPNSYGNLYLSDEYGNQIYVYGLYDLAGNRYSAMKNKPKEGDRIIVCGPIYFYNGTTLEINAGTLIEIC
nr:hypothetical protein [Oscillospiraceae bacterium]